jgi:hypothetical protein
MRSTVAPHVRKIQNPNTPNMTSKNKRHSEAVREVPPPLSALLRKESLFDRPTRIEEAWDAWGGVTQDTGKGACATDESGKKKKAGGLRHPPW